MTRIQVAELYTPVVADTTGFAKGLSGATSDAKSWAKDVDTTFGGVGPSAKSTSKKLAGMANAANIARNALLGGGVIMASKAAYELGVLGAQSLRTKRAFAAISGGALVAADNLDAMRRATRGAMSEQQMMATANQLMQMGLADNAAELEQVATMATRLGSAMGKEAGPAVEEFSLMLANQSIPRLDTFGISASKVRARILVLQAATPGLSREMAFMTATMEEGEAAMERLGEATDDELLANERLEASWADLTAAAGEMLAPAMAEVVGAAAEVTTAIVEQRNEVQRLTTALTRAEREQVEAQYVLNQMGDAAYLTQEQLAALNDEVIVGLDPLDRLRQEAEGVAAAVESGRSQVDGWSSALFRSAEAAGAAAGATRESSEALVEYLETAGDWTETLDAYEDYAAERVSLTREVDREIAEIEAQYASRRYSTIAADEKGILLLQHDYVDQRDKLLGASLYAETELAREAYTIELEMADTAHAEKLARLGEHTAMTEGITRAEADRRIAEIRAGASEELVSLEEGWAAEREALRTHFAEVEVAYLESRLKTAELSAEEREAVEGAMQAIQLEFGLVTEDALAMADAQIILRDAVGKLTSEEYAQVMSDWQEATEDNIITVDELLETTGQLDDEMADRLLKLFPQARDITEEVRDVMRAGGEAAIELREGTDVATSALVDFKDEIIPANTETLEFGENISWVNEMLHQMEGEYYVKVIYVSVGSLPESPPPLQAGTAFHRGGWAIVGEVGPELVALPRGSRVWPTSAPETQAAISNDFGGDTYNYFINDRLAMALALEQNRRRRIERIERM